jgi:antitoxin VapB
VGRKRRGIECTVIEIGVTEINFPREFELPGDDAIIRREGRRLVIEAAPPRSLLAVLATLRPLAEDFPPIEELSHDAVDF